MTDLTLSDETLLQRAGRGDVPAFEQFYDRLSPRVLGILRQMLADEREAEDVLQDGFLYIWEHADQYDVSRSKAFTWAVMIFRNRAIDRIRSLGRRSKLMEAASVESSMFEKRPVAPSAQAEEQERSTEVHAALHVLPVDQRKLIEFAFLKGLTHQAIAESLGLPLGTVKTNIRRGLLRLKELLKGGQP